MRLALSLIQTHHITSRKKIAALRKASSQLGLFVLLKSGSPPGIMYVEQEQAVSETPSSQISGQASDVDSGPSLKNIEKFVSTVKGLRYKDYRCTSKPALFSPRGRRVKGERTVGLEEVSTLHAFREEMTLRGVEDWWVEKMGFPTPSNRSKSESEKG